MKVSLVIKKEIIDSSTSLKIKESLLKNHFVIDEQNPDLVFFVGGDGTFLAAVSKYIDQLDHIRFIGLNSGTLGFFYDYKADEIDKVIALLQKNEFTENRYNLLQGEVQNKDKTIKYYAVNEIRIENPFHTLTCDISINNQYLETFKGNGLVVCGSLGSSAYNKSLGGSLISPNLPLLQVTEIAPLSNNAYRTLGSSLIVDGNDTISLKSNFKHVVIGFDAQVSDLSFADELKITLSDRQVRLLNSKKHSYIQTLNRCFIR